MLKAGLRSRVAVLQIGDSHSANDAFSGRLRELMQARFGDGGRGLLPPGIPYRYYQPAVVGVVADGWSLRRSGRDAGAFGFTAIRQHADGDATMTLSASPPDLAHVFIDVLAQPGGGTLTVTDSAGRTMRVSTAAADYRRMRITAPTGPATATLELRTAADGPVDLLSWTAERDAPGVTWSNLGTIGATMDLVGSWSPWLLREEAQALHPALIVLAFGTNEGFNSTTDLAAYPALVHATLRRLRDAAPQAAILVLGPPGGVRAAGNPTDRPCPDDPGWGVPANLVSVRDIERRVAASEHVLFWDWAAAMGGDCAIVRWAQTDPPLAAQDHVHLLKPGYRLTAERLFESLMRGDGSFRDNK